MQQKALSLMQIQKRFSTEKACQKQWFRLRWPDGFRCPRREHLEAYFHRTRPSFGSEGFLEIRVQSGWALGPVIVCSPILRNSAYARVAPICVAYRDCLRGKPSSKPCHRRAIFTSIG